MDDEFTTHVFATNVASDTVSHHLHDWGPDIFQTTESIMDQADMFLHKHAMHFLLTATQKM